MSLPSVRELLRQTRKERKACRWWQKKRMWQLDALIRKYENVIAEAVRQGRRSDRFGYI